MRRDEPPFICPVCGYRGLAERPYNESGGGSFEICPCCGYEFGFDDDSEGTSHQEYRRRWLADGAPWFDPEQKPDGWDLEVQLRNAAP
ncbi:MAG: hypothetical protein ACRD0G_05840 [Acidimicrobiales bacterium]